MASDFVNWVVGRLDIVEQILKNIRSIISITDSGVTINQASLGSSILSLTSTATNDDPAEDVYQQRIETTTASIANIMTIATAAGILYLVEAVVIARQTGGSAGTVGHGLMEINYLSARQISGVLAATGAMASTVIASGKDDSAWDTDIALSGTNIIIRVAGATNKTITWHTTVRIWRLGT